MVFVREKVRVTIDNIKRCQVVTSKKIEYEYIECPEYKKDNNPPAANAPWKKAEALTRYSGADNHYWLHMNFSTGEPAENCEPRLCVKTGRENEWELMNPQIMVFVDGKNVQAMDTNHTWLPLEFQKSYDVYMYMHTGMLDVRYGVDVRLDIIDLDVEGLFYDMNVPYESLAVLKDKSHDYCKILNALDNASVLIDFRDPHSAEFKKTIKDARDYMKNEFYDKVCTTQGKGVLDCIGHTHIDVAWLWSVAQTKEKAQRSFSTVLNLMKRYDEYKFMSSQPQLYQFVKDNDPDLYAQIKERVKEGRWEPEGGMWLEADTNITGGESLIRQIIYGKRFMKEEFGVDNDIMWLPDVFGYTAALPQILRKTGITKFFTAKMGFNEYNAFPYDVFEWEGIDGSSVFANSCFTYTVCIIPDHTMSIWDKFKNKNISDNVCFTFGHGDGGGGPTYAMLENYRRLEKGLPGMPVTQMRTATEHFKKMQEDFYKNTTEDYSRPRWVGEIYLEAHRGTYTSMAKNKKNNRKSELLYQQAETAATMNMLLCDGQYPGETLKKNYTNILLNQFHDILPGSAIKEVYDVTDKEYEVILREGRDLSDNATNSLKANIKTDGGVFVYNPTPFEMSDYVKVDGKTYYAENVPAHGWKVVDAVEAENSVSVSDDVLENDVIKVTFNNKYHIVSVYDKVSDREVLAKDAEANVLKVYEDYPRGSDAWDITEYYKQKKWVADDVTSVTKLDNGIKIVRKYGKSTITQSILLKPGSKRIDFVTDVDWKADHELLKAEFPVDILSTTATYDIQFGNIKRPTHKNTTWDAAKFEVCAHKWADLSEANYGVSILNDCKYGYSVSGNKMTISLLKAASYPNPEADREFHSFTYSLYPHEGSLEKSDTVKQGYLLNMPFEASYIEANNGKLDNSYSFMSSDNDAVVVETIKKAEEDNSIIVRMYESQGGKTETTVKAGFDFKEVYLCDMLENNQEKLESDGRNVRCKLKNFEIVTLKFVL